MTRVVPFFGPPIEVNPRPSRTRPVRPFVPPVPQVDALLQGPEAALVDLTGFGTTRINVDGIAYSGVSNPDTVGDVGPNHYIQAINYAGVGTAFRILDKSGSVLVNDNFLAALAPPGSRCEIGAGDPIVLYDQQANRWLLSEIAERESGQPDLLCVYVSKTGNPVTGGWWSYAFQSVGFPDYPKYGVWPDAYYASTNEDSNPEGPVAAVYAFERSRMLQGQPARVNRFVTAQLPQFIGFNALTPADLDGSARPPAGSPAYFARHVDDEFQFGATTPTDYLELWAFHANFGNPANATFTRLPNVQMADFDSTICDSTNGGADRCIPQPNPNQRLDSLNEMTMWRLQYRNFNGLGRLVGNFTVDATGQDQAGIRWFVLNKADGFNWFVGQAGTYAPGTASRWMGSVAMDRCANIALGYSVSSSTIFPGIRYAGRLALDPVGQLPRGEHSVIAGGSSYTDFNRWGDYTSMNVDPKDDSTFWYTNQYMDASGRWQTRIASFRFPTCP